MRHVVEVAKFVGGCMPREVMGNRDDLWNMLVGKVAQVEECGAVKKLV
jgi:hypothetical protein